MRFGLEFRESDARTPIIVGEVVIDDSTMQIGVVVDSVSEVIQVTQANVEETPSFGVDVNTKFILGIAKVDDGIKTLLDLDKVLTGEDLAILKANAKPRGD